MPPLDPAVVVLAVIAASLVLFVTEALRYEVTALLMVVVLALTDCLTPEEAFRGFSSGAVVLIAAMYVFGRAVTRWGLAETLGQRLLRLGGKSEARMGFLVTIASGLLSTVLSNTGVCAALIPVVSTVGRRTGIPASRLMMPLAFGSLMGGMVTVIGTSSNIALNGVIVEAGREPFALFEFSALGLGLLVVGSLYFLSPLRRLLPRSRVDESLTEHYQVPKFVSEILVEPSSTLINRSVADMPFFEKYGITVLSIVRSESEASVLAPGPYNRIRTEDVLIVQGEPDALLRMREDMNLRQRESVTVGDQRLDSADVQLVEAVVPSRSSLEDRTLVEADFRANSGLNVLALSKHGHVSPTKIGKTRLSVGDTLLIQGHRRDIERVRRSRDLLVLGEVEIPPLGRGGLVTMVMLALVLLSAALGLVPISVAALTGAIALVLFRCVTAEEAVRAVDWSVVLLVGGVLALGLAFQRAGLGDEVASLFVELADDKFSPLLLLTCILTATILLTQLTNNVAAAVIMAPIAISLAERTGLDDRALLVGVMVAASMAFMSPVGHQANTMVTGPGDYRFKDFLRVGTPLTLLMLLASILLLPLLWPLR